MRFFGLRNASKPDRWTFWQLCVLAFDVLAWWVFIMFVWKLWPR